MVNSNTGYSGRNVSHLGIGRRTLSTGGKAGVLALGNGTTPIALGQEVQVITDYSPTGSTGNTIFSDIITVN